MYFVSFAICTYNRDFIIQECIDSIYAEGYDLTQFEVLLIDNNSTDSTSLIATSYQQKYSNFRYIQEKKQGLSFARNNAYQQAQSPWVFYIDDDATVGEKFIEKTIAIIQHYSFDAFGGRYYAWYKYGKPKWLPNDFGQNKELLPKIGLIMEGFLSGGILCIKKEWLEKTNGFSHQLGMTGTKTAYGEEDQWQIQARKLGAKIGFVPDLYINHCVLPYKLKLGWHLKAEFQHGVAIQQIYQFNSFLYCMIRRPIFTIGSSLLKKLPKAIYYILSKSDYYWQNIILDCIAPIMVSLGVAYSYLQQKSPHS